MSDVDPDVLRGERDNASVLKADLARLRERDRCRMVIVLEGKDDLPVYETWIRRINEGLEWEPLVAKGKTKALEFLDLIRRDKTGLSICTYVIVDHDYDGMRGHFHGNDVFVLPAYSVENYLVHEAVLDSYLRTELRIIGAPEVRARIVAMYMEVRAQFVEIVRKPCEVLFGARNEPVGNVRVGEVKASVTLADGSLSAQSGDWLRGLVQTERAISDDGLRKGERFLAERDAWLWIRGKFLLEFFKDFLCGCLPRS